MRRPIRSRCAIPYRASRNPLVPAPRPSVYVTSLPSSLCMILHRAFRSTGVLYRRAEGRGEMACGSGGGSAPSHKRCPSRSGPDWLVARRHMQCTCFIAGGVFEVVIVRTACGAAEATQNAPRLFLWSAPGLVASAFQHVYIVCKIVNNAGGIPSEMRVSGGVPGCLHLFHAVIFHCIGPDKNMESSRRP